MLKGGGVENYKVRNIVSCPKIDNCCLHNYKSNLIGLHASSTSGTVSIETYILFK